MPATTTWKRGQRWVSDSEPELGLGIILDGSHGRVEIVFPAAGEQRCYAIDTAPLRRVKFQPGDRITTHEGVETTVDQVREESGLRIYQTADGEVTEAQLADSMCFSKPEERLFGGKLDDPGEFDLRGEALRRRADMRRSPARGLAGARVDLIPHQLFIADEVANRLRPRVLLADEVGLGKTIEACLILHRLLITGRASRVLILVPEPLVHQWFVELLRRFNLTFDLFDEERCAAIEEGDPETNPFLDSQLVLAPLDFLAGDEARAAQAREAGWDVLVVDEAHHLEWTPDEAGANYEVVRTLAAQTEGLLLLTATPQQLGPEGHFARLQLLDPGRYRDLNQYREETRHYEEVADLVESLANGGEAGDRLGALTAGRPRLLKAAADFLLEKEGSRERLVQDLLDGCGIGRVMFRNTRARLGGFPERLPLLAPLVTKGKPPLGRDRSPNGPAGDGSESPSTSESRNQPPEAGPLGDRSLSSGDEMAAKVAWLAALLEKKLPAEEKVLVIAKTRELAEQIIESLRDATGSVAALFHEDLTLIQRDRNAAYFADEDGARLLVCSEIGSEGRNFQFARHLVLFDLPDNLDLLEQRIGRLDRIGQRGTINIHVPYLKGTAEETRVRWIHEGLDAFRASPQGAAEIQRELADSLDAALANPKKLKALLTETEACRARISERLARGQDRLLERCSHRPEHAARAIATIKSWDDDAEFEEFLLRLFEHCGLHIEELSRRRYFLLPGNLKSDAFPALPNEGITVTLDRQRALEREQEAFLTWDHPMTRAALDLLLGSEAGNASFGVWESPSEKRMLLEAWVVVECVAPAKLHVERFLPPVPLRIAVDHTGGDQTGDAALASAKLRRGDPAALLRNEAVKRKVLPTMLNRVHDLGTEASKDVIATALQAMHAQLDDEITRLKDLAAMNDHIRPEEIAALEARERELAAAIKSARVRIDAVRLVWKAPAM